MSFGRNVVFLTQFAFDRTENILHVRYIHSPESTQLPGIDSNFQVYFFLTMGGQLLVIGRDPDIDRNVMMSFDSENAMSGTSERINFPDRPGKIKRRSRDFAYGVLENEGVEILIVAGKYVGGEMFCESYVMSHIGWTTCASPPVLDSFGTWIVWQNQLVVKSGRTFYVYNHDEDDWLTEHSSIRSGKFFLNAKNHLCLENPSQVWCLSPLETTWVRKPNTYVLRKNGMELIGTLPIKIISAMAT